MAKKAKKAKKHEDREDKKEVAGSESLFSQYLGATHFGISPAVEIHSNYPI